MIDPWDVISFLIKGLWKTLMFLCRIIKRFIRAIAQDFATILATTRGILITKGKYGLLEKITVGTLLIICEEIAR